MWMYVVILVLLCVEAAGCVIFGPFSNVDSFRPDVISAVVIDQTGMKVRVKFGDSRSNRSRNIRLPHFVTNDDDNDDDDAGRRTPMTTKTPPFA